MENTNSTTTHHVDADHVVARIAGIGTEYLVVVRPLSGCTHDVLLAGGPDRTYGTRVAQGLATFSEAIAHAANLAAAELAAETGEAQPELRVRREAPLVDDLMFTRPTSLTDELRRLASDRSGFAAGCERSSEGLFALLVEAARMYTETTEAQAGQPLGATSPEARRRWGFAVAGNLQAVAENLEA